MAKLIWHWTAQVVRREMTGILSMRMSGAGRVGVCWDKAGFIKQGLLLHCIASSQLVAVLSICNFLPAAFLHLFLSFALGFGPGSCSISASSAHPT
jgi:hypothetical protein